MSHLCDSHHMQGCIFQVQYAIAVFPSLADVVEVKTASRSTAHWFNDFIRLDGWLRNSFAQLITLLDIDGIGQNREDSNTGMEKDCSQYIRVVIHRKKSRVMHGLLSECQTGACTGTLNIFIFACPRSGFQQTCNDWPTSEHVSDETAPHSHSRPWSLAHLQMLTDVICQDPQTCPHVLENR